MPRGSNAKREHEYEKLKTEFKKDHRYPGREEEVAARIIAACVSRPSGLRAGGAPYFFVYS